MTFWNRFWLIGNQMKKLFAFLALFLGLGFSAKPQENQQFELVYSIEKPHDYIWTDNLQNLYLIHESGLELYNPQGHLLFQNSQLNLGRISSVDFKFSLKPLLFYRELNAVVILDNTLSMQGNPVKLSNHNINWATVAAKSVDNHYWFYDAQIFEIIRTDISFKHVRSSGNISQLIGFDIDPVFMVEQNNWLYVNNPATGILVFDIFGTYYKQIPLTGLDTFQVTDSQILYLKDGKICSYDLTTFEKYDIELPLSGAKYARVVKDLLFVSDGNKIQVFRNLK